MRAKHVALVSLVVAVAAVARADEPPSTVLDPPAYAPRPVRDEGRACVDLDVGAPVGVCRHGQDDEARGIVRRFLEALVARDVGTLESLTADPVVRYDGGLTWSRNDLLAALLRAADARGLGRGTDVASYVDLAGAHVVPAQLRPGTRLRAGDQVVLAPLRGRVVAQAPMGTLVFEHAGQLRLVVRVAPDARVVAM